MAISFKQLVNQFITIYYSREVENVHINFYNLLKFYNTVLNVYNLFELYEKLSPSCSNYIYKKIFIETVHSLFIS